MAKAFCDEKIASTDIFMISKSYCPFCTKAKKALDSIGAKYEVLEIENRKGKHNIELWDNLGYLGASELEGQIQICIHRFY